MNAVLVVIDSVRRDHLGCYGNEAPSARLAAPIRTPHLDALAARGARFENCFLGSFPCMPARRELWTGRFEFPWRGWGPLEDGDLDLFDFLRSHGLVTAMVSDHYHLLERDAGNYHFGFRGWEMLRGQEHDPFVTAPAPVEDALDHRLSGVWRQHRRNQRGLLGNEEDLFAPRVFRRAAAWLEDNAAPALRRQRPFCLLVECFDPHEPWDPPLHTVEAFDPGFGGKRPQSPVYGAAERFTEAELRQMRALYAAELELVDRWFGRFLETFERLGLFGDTLLVVTTDHGFFLGEHGLVGKPDGVPLYREMSHIPLLVCHPDAHAGQRVLEPVQWVDVLPTVLDALGLPPPAPEPQAWTVGRGHKKAWEGLAAEAGTLHGSSLLPLTRGEAGPRRLATSGKFGDIVRVTDGRRALYLPPEDAPLTWYGRRTPGRTFAGRHGPYDPAAGGYPVRYPAPTRAPELYDLASDPGEAENLHTPDEAAALRRAFAAWLAAVGAPAEVAVRYGVAP